MTVSTDPGAPLVVIVGSTGIQGGSVIRNLVASGKPYRLRGLTRDAGKPAAARIAGLGADIVEVNIIVDNEAAVQHAFRDADVIFAVTNFWEHTDSEREIAQGMLMADAAKAVGAKLFIFSGLPSVVDLSAGKYTRVKVSDGKAKVVNYARTLLPTVDVQAGFYITNLLNPVVGPAKQDDGGCLWEQLTDVDRPIPFIDIEHDYGLFVRFSIEKFLENPSNVPATIYTYSEMLRPSEAAAILERVRRIKTTLRSLDGDFQSYRKKLAGLGMSEDLIQSMLESSACAAEHGFFFGLESAEDQ